MNGITRVDNVIFLKPSQRAPVAPPRCGRWVVLLSAALVISVLSGLGLGVEPQPLPLDDEGRPTMLIE